MRAILITFGIICCFAALVAATKSVFDVLGEIQQLQAMKVTNLSGTGGISHLVGVGGPAAAVALLFAVLAVILFWLAKRPPREGFPLD